MLSFCVIGWRPMLLNMEICMSVLDTLQVVPAGEQSVGYDPIKTRRKKLAATLQDQLNLLLAGDAASYRRVRTERKRDLETDEVFEVQHRRRVVPWWFFDDAGQVRFSIRYGSVTLKLKGEDGVIVLPTIEALQDLLPALRRDVLKGELDGPLRVAADALLARFKPATASSAKKTG